MHVWKLCRAVNSALQVMAHGLVAMEGCVNPQESKMRPILVLAVSTRVGTPCVGQRARQTVT
jgi:hypothetical protein|tara:strand:- start:9988 stop:10173 length:186 start_codon:yes stop_codon:yes gene_type:complete